MGARSLNRKEYTAMDELDHVDSQFEIEALMEANSKAELIDLAKAEGATFSRRGSKTEIARELVEARAEKQRRVVESAEVAPEPEPAPDPLAGKSLDERRVELEAACAADTAARDLAEQPEPEEVVPEPEPDVKAGVVRWGGDTAYWKDEETAPTTSDVTGEVVVVINGALPVPVCVGDALEFMAARVAVGAAVKEYNAASGGGRVHAPVQRAAKMVARAALASLLNARVA